MTEPRRLTLTDAPCRITRLSLVPDPKEALKIEVHINWRAGDWSRHEVSLTPEEVEGLLNFILWRKGSQRQAEDEEKPPADVQAAVEAAVDKARQKREAR